MTPELLDRLVLAGAALAVIGFVTAWLLRPGSPLSRWLDRQLDTATTLENPT